MLHKKLRKTSENAPNALWGEGLAWIACPLSAYCVQLFYAFCSRFDSVRAPTQMSETQYLLAPMQKRFEQIGEKHRFTNGQTITDRQWKVWRIEITKKRISIKWTQARGQSIVDGMNMFTVCEIIVRAYYPLPPSISVISNKSRIEYNGNLANKLKSVEPRARDTENEYRLVFGCPWEWWGVTKVVHMSLVPTNRYGQNENMNNE